MKTSVYRSFGLHNYLQIAQADKITPEMRHAIEVVGAVLPFKTNNYVVDELIDWSNIPDDPMFTLNFPRYGMLTEEHFNAMSKAIRQGVSKDEKSKLSNEIRMSLNPHPAGQQYNIPEIEGHLLPGMQHKYRETALFFPGQGQTCHAYCTFCFRWPQFVGISELKFAMKETELLTKYLAANPSITDLLFTGGDPMIMKTKVFSTYVDPILEKNIENIQTIRIGTKALAYWPYRFTEDDDADDLIRLFEKIVNSGRNLSIMAHFNHPVELRTEAVKKAISRIRSTGAQIRTQSPLLLNINDDPKLWAAMWREQVNLNCIPYYMFVERDTGSKSFFELPLVRAWEIFREAYQTVSGVCRTVRGPSMSATPGKVQVLGVSEIKGEKVIVLRFLQGRNPEWVGRPFFAKYDKNAMWLDQLQPAFGEKEFFFESELQEMLHVEETIG